VLGLEGDRYALKQGTFYKPEPDFELTLIEAEAIEALRREYDIELAAGEARRNIVTRDVALNQLVGIGVFDWRVAFGAFGLCEPCDHFAEDHGQVRHEGLLHRGGLRAQILTQGRSASGIQ